MKRLLGRLNWIAFVFRSGKTFLKRLYAGTYKALQNHHRVPLRSQETRKDLLWWKTMLPQIPERDILHDRENISSYDLHLHTDASKTHGAAVYGTAWGIVKFGTIISSQCSFRQNYKSIYHQNVFHFLSL